MFVISFDSTILPLGPAGRRGVLGNASNSHNGILKDTIVINVVAFVRIERVLPLMPSFKFLDTGQNQFVCFLPVHITEILNHRDGAGVLPNAFTSDSVLFRRAEARNPMLTPFPSRQCEGHCGRESLWVEKNAP